MDVHADEEDMLAMHAAEHLYPGENNNLQYPSSYPGHSNAYTASTSDKEAWDPQLPVKMPLWPVSESRQSTSQDPTREQDPRLAGKKIWAPRLPDHNITTIMRDALPRNARINSEAKELMNECVTEFIQFVTSQANDNCRSISGKEIIRSLNELGFDNYASVLEVYMGKCMTEGETEGKMKGKAKGNAKGKGKGKTKGKKR